MRRMTLVDVEKITGVVNMTLEQPRKLASPGFGCAQQATALSLHSWNNTREDWLRLQACLTHLRGARISVGGAAIK
jgi:hypothetical protein